MSTSAIDATELEDILRFCNALSSELRVKVVQSLCKGPKNLREISDYLRSAGHEVRYRETVFRSAEKLVDAGLVEKAYRRGTGVVYMLKVPRLVIDLCAVQPKPHSPKG